MDDDFNVVDENVDYSKFEDLFFEKVKNVFAVERK